MRCTRQESKQKLHVVQFKLSIALKLLLSVFLELTAAPAGEVIQYVPAAAHIRAEQLYNYYIALNALFAIWTATTTKIWRRHVHEQYDFVTLFM